MQAHDTAQRSLPGAFGGGWRMLVLSMLALVLSMQPFMCLLHCAQWDLLRRSSAAPAYAMLCSAGDQVGGDTIVAAVPGASVAAGAAASVPAYWPGMLSTWMLVLGLGMGVRRTRPAVVDGSALWVALPVTPPPRYTLRRSHP